MNLIKLHQFEGPLDLLLQLIESEKLSINTIALSQVAQQYAQIVYDQRDIPLEEIADYLVIVSKLLLIKSRTLLPNLALEEESDVSLVDQLKMYQRYHDQTPVIEKLWQSLATSFPHPKPSAQWIAHFRPPTLVGVGGLVSTMRSVIQALVPPKAVLKQLVDRAITLQQKIRDFTAHVAQVLSTQFSRLVKDPSNKTEVIVSFLAILELVKRQSVDVQQSDAFGDMVIRHRSV